MAELTLLNSSSCSLRVSSSIFDSGRRVGVTARGRRTRRRIGARGVEQHARLGCTRVGVSSATADFLGILEMKLFLKQILIQFIIRRKKKGEMAFLVMREALTLQKRSRSGDEQRSEATLSQRDFLDFWNWSIAHERAESIRFESRKIWMPWKNGKNRTQLKRIQNI